MGINAIPISRALFLPISLSQQDWKMLNPWGEGSAHFFLELTATPECCSVEVTKGTSVRKLLIESSTEEAELNTEHNQLKSHVLASHPPGRPAQENISGLCLRQPVLSTWPKENKNGPFPK